MSSHHNLSSTSLLTVENLAWQVDGIQILRDLSLSVEKGEFVGIIGPNGAGKSTLLRCLFGKYTPSAGNVWLRQKNINQYSRNELAKNMAVVLQESPADFDLKVKDVIQMGLIPHKSLFSLDSVSDRKVVAWGAEQVDVLDKLHQPFKQLSGGEKQRVMIARAMVQCPKILLLDEPTNHLDIHHQIEVLHLVKQMETSVLASIHDLNLAAAFCDRILLLNDGRRVAFGTPEQVLTTHNLKQVFNVDAVIDAHPFHQGLRITFAMHPQGEPSAITN